MYNKVRLLAERTINELDVDVKSLTPGSSRHVFVQCVYCNEIFRRRWCNISKMHSCATVVHGKKHCPKCNQYLSFDLFSPDKTKKHNVTSWCTSCTSNDRKERRSEFDYWLKKHLILKKSQCNKNSIPFDLDVDFLKERWSDQNERCFYSQIKLKHHHKGLNAAQLERIDSAGGYVKGNVVWASRAFNTMKSNSTHDEFVEFLNESIGRRNGLARLECQLIHKDAKLPFQKRNTDVGHDLYSVEDVAIDGQKMVNVHTGIIISCPPGWFFTIEGRSSLWKHGIMPNCGIIDATYCGELQVALYNYTNVSYMIKKGDRIAQIILQKVYAYDLILVDDFGPDYNQRGTAGFGSSGR